MAHWLELFFTISRENTKIQLLCETAFSVQFPEVEVHVSTMRHHFETQRSQPVDAKS